MGQDSFSRAIQKWIDQKRLFPPQSPSASPSTESYLRMYKCAKLWKLGCEEQLPDGSTGIDPHNHETFEYCKEIDANFALQDKEMEEGTFTPEYGVDALIKVVGKLEHRGRVKVTGVGLIKSFGKRSNKGKHSIKMVPQWMR